MEKTWGDELKLFGSAWSRFGACAAHHSKLNVGKQLHCEGVGASFGILVGGVRKPELNRAGRGGYARGTRTSSDCGTAVTISGVGSSNTSPSMPTFRCARADCTRMRTVRKERNPGIVRTRPAA